MQETKSRDRAGGKFREQEDGVSSSDIFSNPKIEKYTNETTAHQFRGQQL